jgi:hypothetical protein
VRGFKNEDKGSQGENFSVCFDDRRVDDCGRSCSLGIRASTPATKENIKNNFRFMIFLRKTIDYIHTIVLNVIKLLAFLNE